VTPVAVVERTELAALGEGLQLFSDTAEIGGIPAAERTYLLVDGHGLCRICRVALTTSTQSRR
jgi:hypothetical protein